RRRLRRLLAREARERRGRSRRHPRRPRRRVPARGRSVSVRARLVLFGAVLPTAFLLVAVVIGGALFRREQLADVDRRLLAQAAVESVGLFDSPDGTPHVHLPRSPLAREVEAFAPDAALYDETGALAINVDDPSRVPARVPLEGTPG